MLTAELMSLRLSGGVLMLTAMITSPHSLRTSSIGRLLEIAPSTSRRPSISTGRIAPGIDMLARIACARLPWSSTTASPVSMSVATARNGIGSFEKSATPADCWVRPRIALSIGTPDTTPFGASRLKPRTPNSGANSVL